MKSHDSIENRLTYAKGQLAALGIPFDESRVESLEQKLSRAEALLAPAAIEARNDDPVKAAYERAAAEDDPVKRAQLFAERAPLWLTSKAGN